MNKRINTDLLHADLTYGIRRAIFNVYNGLGFGHKEKVYQKALIQELQELNIPFKREVSLNVKYKGEDVGNYRPDFVIDDKVIVELKAVEFMPKSYETQLIHYLKTTGFQLGLLVNFGATKLYIKRLIWSGHEHPRKSIPNQRESGFIKFTKKTLISTFIVWFVLIGTGLIYLFNPFQKEVSAAWFNDDWAYRKPVNFTHNAAVSNTQVELDIDTTDSPDKFQTDCGDVRFTDINGNLLRYYLNSAAGACDTTSTDFDVLIPSIVNGSNTIYIYYGNPNATNGTEAADFSEATTTPSGGAPSASTEEKGTSPIGYWKFDEGTGTVANDTTSNANTGTIDGSSWQSEDMCVSGKCMFYDGTDDTVSIANESKFDFEYNDKFTISSWIRYSDTSGSLEIFSKLLNNGTTYRGYEFGTLATSGVLYAFLINDFTGNLYILSSGSTNVADGKWHHVAMTYDGSNLGSGVTFYVDGKPDTTTVTTDTLGTNTILNDQTPYIASRADAVFYFKGFIDDVKVYKDQTTRTAAQVRADANSRGGNEGTGVSFAGDSQRALSSGLAGYWKLDESSSGAGAVSRTDSSGNGNTLTDNNTTPSGVGKFSNNADFEFDNNEYLSIADNSTLSTGDINFGFSVWVNGETLPASGETRGIVAKDDLTTNREYLIYAQNTGAGVYFGWAVGNGATIPGIVLSDPAAFVPATSTWYHIAVWHDADNNIVGMRINDQYEVTAATTGTPADSTTVFNIGNFNNANSFINWDGKIDEVRMYKRLLTRADISTLYNFAPGPVGHWKFDEKTGTSANDSSGNGNDTTWFGDGTQRWESGKIGSAGRFRNANNDRTAIAAGDEPNFDITGPISLTAWIKVSAFNVAWQAIVTKGEGTWRLQRNNTNNTITFDTNVGDVLATTTNVNDGKWHHIAATYDGVNKYIYVDGVLENSTAYTSAIATNNSLVEIGYNIGAAGRGWEGNLDEVKVYNYARTPAQVVQDMNGGHPAPGSPVGSAVGYWKFDEGADNTCSGGVNDACNSGSGGNGADGAVTGTTWTNSGKFGKALTFDSTDEISLGHPTSLDVQNSFTLSAWVLPTSAPSGAGVITESYSGDGDRVQYEIGFGIDEGGGGSSKLKVGFYTGAAWAIASDSSNIATGSWVHIAGTWDGTTLRLYKNGIEIATNVPGLTSAADTETIYLGRRHDTAGDVDVFPGTIDEPKIYSSALTADQVKQDMNRSSQSIMGALSDNSSYQLNAANQEYCVPGDSTSCAAPVGIYNFNEASGQSIFDTSGNANNGFVGDSNIVDISDPTWTHAKFSKGLKFDNSNDSVLISGTSTFDFGSSTNFTVEAWFNTTQDRSIRHVIAMNNSSENPGATPGYLISITTSGTIEGKLNDGSTDISIASTGTVDDNKWHHVVFSVNRSNPTVLYLDGINVASSNSTPTGSTANSDLFKIGSHSTNSAVFPFGGKIDQVIVFDYARSATQVAWDFNRGGPVGWWKFDECQGTTAYDASGTNSNNGTITIGATGDNDDEGNCTTVDTTTSWYNGRTGKLNYSLDFDGTDDYVDVTSALYSTVPFSVCLWFNQDNVNADKVLFWIGDDGGADWDAHYIAAGDNAKVEVYSAVGNDFTAVATSTSSYTASSWYHTCGVWTSSTSRSVYVNGNLEATNTTSASPADIDGMFIGKHGVTGGGALANGKIDDVRIYNYALTATQVKNIMNDASATRFGPSTGSP